MQQNAFFCEFCENIFAGLRDLMKHKKDHHTENVNICWNYMSSSCEFGDERCWFIHKNGTEKQFDCTLCGKIFGVQAKLLEHKRKHHMNSVKTCRSLSTGTCKYGQSKCWFNYTESANTNEIQLHVLETQIHYHINILLYNVLKIMKYKFPNTFSIPSLSQNREMF